MPPLGPAATIFTGGGNGGGNGGVRDNGGDQPELGNQAQANDAAAPTNISSDIATPSAPVAQNIAAQSRAPTGIVADSRATPLTTPAAKSSTSHRLPAWARLTMRERIMSILLICGMVLIPASMPSAKVEQSHFNASDPDLQPTERAEENFAGSAFYFIDPAYAMPENYGDFDSLAAGNSASPLTAASGLAGDEDRAAFAHLIHPVPFRGSAIDNSRALQCMTSAIYYEAGLEPEAGQRAVAQVILNRVRHPSYPNSVCGVVFQGSERRTGCQFSYTCDGSLARKPDNFQWQRARKVAIDALAGRINSMVGTATHYHASYVYPYWAPSLRFLGTIGAHRFYSWKGSAGRAVAFSQQYRGGEPLPAPKPRKYDDSQYADAANSLDPLALERAYERAYEEAKRKAQADAVEAERSVALAADNARRHDRAAPPLDASGSQSFRIPDYSAAATAKGGDSAYAGQKLPDSSRVKPEFNNSGTWKAKPGG